MNKQDQPYGVQREEDIDRIGVKYHRMIARTPWLKEGDDLGETAIKAFGDHLKDGGTLVIAEKVCVVTIGNMVPVSTVKPHWLAKFASKFVRPIGEDLAQSIPERMQFVIDRIGYPRTLLACAASAVTKPFGIRGAFFVIAGYQARDLDGMHGEYLDWLLPPLRPREAQNLVDKIAAKTKCPVAIVDVNDRGGHVRARSEGAVSTADLIAIFKDNPMGHKNTSTPMTMVKVLG